MQYAQIKYVNNDVYLGQTLRGRKQGRGWYYYHNGDIYEGEWDDNLRAGKGTLTCKKGDLCKGEFVKDEFVSGIYIDVKGSIYKSMDHPDGKPTLNGTFLRGRLVGYGRAEFADGGVYDGTFKDGKRSG